MSFLAILALAFAMAADAFAVSVSHGSRLKRMDWSEALRIAFVFAALQGLMPLIGWFVGRAATDFVSTYGKWIAFALLVGVALKMLWEVFGPSDDEDEDKLAGSDGIVSNWEILVVGIATSIDALAAGIGLAFVDLSIGQAATVIALCTFVLCLLGVWLGRQLGALIGRRAEILGAVILIGLAIHFVTR